MHKAHNAYKAMADSQGYLVGGSRIGEELRVGLAWLFFVHGSLANIALRSKFAKELRSINMIFF